MNGVVLFDITQEIAVPIPEQDPDERRLVEEVDRLRRELYAEEERARGTRQGFMTNGHYHLGADGHAYLDAVSARVTKARTDLRCAERNLQVHREMRRRR